MTLSPTLPTTGAGIARLNPIPEVQPGNVDLIAPLGTIDAGEAGIRASGNVNLAALQIVNAANIQVQGRATGIPVVHAPPVAALSSAGNATAATQLSAAPTQSNNDRPSVILVEFLGFGGGDGSPTPNPTLEKKRSGDDGRAQNPDSAYQVLGGRDDDGRGKAIDRRTPPSDAAIIGPRRGILKRRRAPSSTRTFASCRLSRGSRRTSTLSALARRQIFRNRGRSMAFRNTLGVR
ncbi:filamentous haemagglutinin family protein [Bradyrhizobium sp. Leo121]|uniref:filamentous haemagglutinin family protein n=1 Tax=Bradyrhizobium sp. Leo121 TaxID=1571195 RepID=UPI0010295DB6|nr:filamentous haemagglutinin family protein [Bradyrhizobium sp. Leo121]RZN31269.1 hypothetical protein CWO90_17680 [Bradyrhizobium sp. Leo121]